ncbi:hypothetical protein [Ferrimicrobium acidiphilum]|uniref:Uncharacterized protein n=1 Tax=Ferrimicrobium acidiphilum TaxID=121039 RepID=A0ABV3Y5H1_9ACTN
MSRQSETIRPDAIPKVIFAARDPGDVFAMIPETEPTWVFLLGGNAAEVLGASKLLAERGFEAFVHVDMLHGITNLNFPPPPRLIPTPSWGFGSFWG